MKSGELKESGMKPTELPESCEGRRVDRVQDEAYGVTRVLSEGWRADRVRNEAYGVTSPE